MFPAFYNSSICTVGSPVSMIRKSRKALWLQGIANDCEQLDIFSQIDIYMEPSSSTFYGLLLVGICSNTSSLCPA